MSAWPISHSQGILNLSCCIVFPSFFYCFFYDPSALDSIRERRIIFCNTRIDTRDSKCRNKPIWSSCISHGFDCHLQQNNFIQYYTIRFFNNNFIFSFKRYMISLDKPDRLIGLKWHFVLMACFVCFV